MMEFAHNAPLDATLKNDKIPSKTCELLDTACAVRTNKNIEDATYAGTPIPDVVESPHL